MKKLFRPMVVRYLGIWTISELGPEPPDRYWTYEMPGKLDKILERLAKFDQVIYD